MSQFMVEWGFLKIIVNNKNNKCLFIKQIKFINCFVGSRIINKNESRRKWIKKQTNYDINEKQQVKTKHKFNK